MAGRLRKISGKRNSFYDPQITCQFRSQPAGSGIVSAMTDNFLAGVIAASEMDLKVSLLASGQLESTSYEWYLVDRDYKSG
jgi:hypothetical protein